MLLTVAMGVGVSAAPTYSFGVFIGPLMEAYGWSLGQVVFAQSMMSLIVGLASPIAGIVVDRIGVRLPALIGTVVVSSALAGFSLINGSLLAYYACWAVVAIGTTLASVVFWLSPVVRQFDRTRGLAISVALCGSNLTGAITPMIAVWLIGTHGWQHAYLGVAAYVFLTTFPLAWFFFHERRLEASSQGAAPASADTAELPGMETKAALRTLNFWMIAFSFLLTGAGIVAFIVHLVPMLGEIGISPTLAAGAVSMLSFSAIAGRLACGILIDHLFAPYVAAFVVSLGTIASLILLLAPPVYAFALAAAILIGITTGAEFSMLSYLVSKYFGLRKYAILSGFVFGAFTIGTFLGPVLTAMSYQLSGGYQQAFVSLAVCFAAAAIVMLFCSRYPEFAEKE